jgi:hypothetical protein
MFSRLLYEDIHTKLFKIGILLFHVVVWNLLSRCEERECPGGVGEQRNETELWKCSNSLTFVTIYK